MQVKIATEFDLEAKFFPDPHNKEGEQVPIVFLNIIGEKIAISEATALALKEKMNTVLDFISDSRQGFLGY